MYRLILCLNKGRCPSWRLRIDFCSTRRRPFLSILIVFSSSVTKSCHVWLVELLRLSILLPTRVSLKSLFERGRKHWRLSEHEVKESWSFEHLLNDFTHSFVPLSKSGNNTIDLLLINAWASSSKNNRHQSRWQVFRVESQVRVIQDFIQSLESRSEKTIDQPLSLVSCVTCLFDTYGKFKNTSAFESDWLIRLILVHTTNLARTLFYYFKYE